MSMGGASITGSVDVEVEAFADEMLNIFCAAAIVS